MKTSKVRLGHIPRLERSNKPIQCCNIEGLWNTGSYLSVHFIFLLICEGFKCLAFPTSCTVTVISPLVLHQSSHATFESLDGSKRRIVSLHCARFMFHHQSSLYLHSSSSKLSAHKHYQHLISCSFLPADIHNWAKHSCINTTSPFTYIQWISLLLEG